MEAADRKSGFVAPGEGNGVMRRRRRESACEGDPSNSCGALTSATVNKGKDVEGRDGGIVPNVSPELRTLLNRDIIRAK